MKSKLEQLKEDVGFQKFLAEIKNTANYFVAVNGDEHAVDLVMAYAYAAGKDAGKLVTILGGPNTGEAVMDRIGTYSGHVCLSELCCDCKGCKDCCKCPY